MLHLCHLIHFCTRTCCSWGKEVVVSNKFIFYKHGDFRFCICVVIKLQREDRVTYAKKMHVFLQVSSSGISKENVFRYWFNTADGRFECRWFISITCRWFTLLMSCYVDVYGKKKLFLLCDAHYILYVCYSTKSLVLVLLLQSLRCKEA